MMKRNDDGIQPKKDSTSMCLYISKEHRKTTDALAYWREKRLSVCDQICEAVEKEYELQQAKDRNHNMMWYMDEHQMRLGVLSRIDQYYDYRTAKGKSVVKMFNEDLITQSDLLRIYRSARMLLNEIDRDAKSRDAINSLILNELEAK